jgi:hypothetical protein
MNKRLMFVAVFALSAALCIFIGKTITYSRKVQLYHHMCDSLGDAISNCGNCNPGSRIDTGVCMNDSDLIDTGTASAQIANWATQMSAGQASNSNPQANTFPQAFIIKMSDISAAQASYNCTALLVYIGLNSSNQVSLMWSPLTGMQNAYTAVYPINSKSNTAGELFDHTLPCPICGVIGALGGISSANIPPVNGGK